MTIDDTSPNPSPYAALRAMVDAQLARQFGGIVAGVQATHYHRLLEEGVNEPAARELTERTTEVLVTNARDIMQGIAEMIGAFGKAIAPIIDNIETIQGAIQSTIEFSEKSQP